MAFAERAAIDSLDQGFDYRRMAQEGLRASTGSIGTRLEYDDEIAGTRRRKVHSIAQEIERRA